jgi:hypothetical protein
LVNAAYEQRPELARQLKDLEHVADHTTHDIGSRRVSVLCFGRSQPTEPRVARPRYLVLTHGGFEPGEEDKKDYDGCEEARYEFKDLIEVAHSSSSDDRPRSARRFRWRPVEAGEPCHGSEPVVGAWPMGPNRVESGAADDAT